MLLLFLLLAPVSASSPEFKLSYDADNTLTYLYNHLEVEYAFCAYGKKKGNTVVVDTIRLPVIISSTDSEVWYNYGSCPTKNLLGIGHSHPAPSECTLSQLDLHSFLYSPFPYAFLVCPDGERRVFVKKEVRKTLLERGLLAEALKPRRTQ